jgi:hypothetical protein
MPSTAVIDRLLHHCHIVTIHGNSNRMRRHSELWRSLNPPSQEHSASASSPPRKNRKTKEEINP